VDGSGEVFAGDDGCGEEGEVSLKGENGGRGVGTGVSTFWSRGLVMKYGT
jgi:hypothetical protein